MNISVPYFSQYSDIADPYWRDRACAVACVKMVLEMRGIASPALEALVKESAELFGYEPALGWKHDALVKIFEKYGLSAERKEFKEDGLFEKGISEIVSSLLKGSPVLVSAVKNFSEEKKFHIVLLVGYEKKDGEIAGFYYHDPAFEKAEDGANKFVPMDIFKKHWRRLAIFPHVS